MPEFTSTNFLLYPGAYQQNETVCLQPRGDDKLSKLSCKFSMLIVLPLRKISLVLGIWQPLYWLHRLGQPQQTVQCHQCDHHRQGGVWQIFIQTQKTEKDLQQVISSERWQIFKWVLILVLWKWKLFKYKTHLLTPKFLSSSRIQVVFVFSNTIY